MPMFQRSPIFAAAPRAGSRSPHVNVPVGHHFWSWWRKFVKRHIIDDDPPSKEPRIMTKEELTKVEQDYHDLCVEYVELTHIFLSARGDYEEMGEEMRRGIRSAREHLNKSVAERRAEEKEMLDGIVRLQAAAAFAWHISDETGTSLKEIADLLQQSEELSGREVKEGLAHIRAVAIQLKNPEAKRDWRGVLASGKAILDLGKKTDLAEKIAPFTPAIRKLIEKANHYIK
jgi:hypothetical protein